MKISSFRGMKKELKVYFGIIALTALTLGFSNDILSNYFKDAYNVTAYQRGIIEFPREIPGFLCVFLVAGLSFINDIRIAIISQILSIIGIAVLGVLTPPFAVMLIFIFINSLGMHLFMPLQDSIGLALIDQKNIGKRMGQFKGVATAFQMMGAIVVFIGFKAGFFSFTTPVKWIFIISAIVLAVVLLLLVILDKMTHNPDIKHEKFKLVLRKEYKFYYVLVVMFGVHKQMMIVYGPWVLVDLLNKKADTLAILGIIGSFAGIFFIPALGRWMDKLGIKKMLYADALSFVGVYLLYGLLTMGYSNGTLAKVGIPVFLAYGLFIIDRMSAQMGLVRTVYLRRIAVEDSDITPTLSFGMSMDHIVSIISAYLGGIVWTLLGPQYIFFLAAGLSLVNLYVAFRVKLKE